MGVAVNEKKPKFRAGRKTSQKCYRAGGQSEDKGGREEAEDHAAAGGACAEGSVVRCMRAGSADFRNVLVAT
eukprot:6211403-Pleurochrysis_carterae.AAC.3